MRTRRWWAVPWEHLPPPAERVLMPARGPKPKDAWPAQTFHLLSKTRSRRKGSELEIRVAKALNDWLYGGQPVLRRTPLSGGWSPGMGDISVDPQQLAQIGGQPPSLYVECKRGQGIRLRTLMRWAAGFQIASYTRWWKEALGDRTSCMVMLVVQGDGEDPWVLARPANSCLEGEAHNIQGRIWIGNARGLLVPLEKLKQLPRPPGVPSEGFMRPSGKPV